MSDVKKAIATKDAPGAIGPYSQAIEAGGFLFLSGQIPLDPETGQFLSGTIQEQTERVMRNLEAVLKARGLGFEHVVKTTVYLKSMSDFASFNEVYGRYLREPYPARACFAVAELPKGALVEVEAVAVCR